MQIIIKQENTEGEICEIRCKIDYGIARQSHIGIVDYAMYELRPYLQRLVDFIESGKDPGEAGA